MVTLKEWTTIQRTGGDCRLLEPGWAGHVDDDELAYIRSELYRDPVLARLWGRGNSYRSVIRSHAR